MQLSQLTDRLPEPLLASGPFGVLAWQWLGLLALISLSVTIGRLLGRPTRALLRRLVLKTSNDYDDALVAASRGPVILVWSVTASLVLMPLLDLAERPSAGMLEIQKSLVIVAVFWMILRAIGVLQVALPKAAWAESRPAVRTLIPLFGRFAGVAIFAMAVLTIIAQFGYPVGTILAGLGIGGIAIALGAQKSLEHFFGSVSIGIDQPFRVGDWVSVSGIQGTVEAIGLRSSRLRTMDRTIVTIPNGQLAEAQSENFGERERIRLNAVIGLEYGTPAATIRKIRDEIEALLRAHRKTWPERVQVRFFQFGSSSLDLELFCWIETKMIDEFRAIREEILLGVMDVVERNGASFAFPTQKVHLVRGDAVADGGVPPRGSSGQPL